MSVTVNNIGLYLAKRKGNDSNFLLSLAIYTYTPPLQMVPNDYPIARAFRSVSDINSDGYYVFNFDNPVVLETGHYYMVLTQEHADITDPVDFSSNFVEWIHSGDYLPKGEFAISSASGFEPDIDYGYGYAYGYGMSWGYAYGYGHGYGNEEGYNYFDVLGVDGNKEGEGEFQSGYGYGTGIESVYYNYNNSVARCFKIYENFNDFYFDDTSKNVIVNLPVSVEEDTVIENRQDFMDAERSGIDIVGNTIALADSGGRVYSVDASVFDTSKESLDWYESNFFLSNNDINSADISNHPSNTNQYRTWLISAPYYAGIYFSTDGGSAWRQRIDNLSLDDNTIRNFSCVKMFYDSSLGCFYTIAFDDTNDNERGKVFIAILSYDVFDDDGNVIVENSVIADNVVWIECGRVTSGSGTGLRVNTSLFVGSELWVGTDAGVYTSSDYGTWINWTVSSGFDTSIKVYRLSASYNPLYAYGYGFGYGEGGDYFDVLGVSGQYMGYGVDWFESNYINSYGFGYGYEETWGNGTKKEVYAATDDGIYKRESLTWVALAYSQLGGQDCYCIHLVENNIYVGLDSGMMRSIDSGDSFEGQTPSTDSFYPYGLLPRKTTSIFSNTKDNSEIFVSQYGGVSISKNDGGNFTVISGNLKEKRVKFLLQNPLNGRILYAFTETSNFENTAITFIIDTSGSMTANDPDVSSVSARVNLVKKIMSEIHSSASSTSYFQIIDFDLREFSTSRETGYKKVKELGYEDCPWARILTKTGDKGGFIAAKTDDGSIISSLSDIAELAMARDHSRTPLFDTLDVVAEGVNKSGASWTYNTLEGRYEVADVSSEYFKKLRKVVIILTDGHDNVGGKGISDMVGISSNFANMRSTVYVVGVGNNINYSNLLAIKEAHPFSYLYIPSFSEVLYRGGLTTYSDISDLILEKETEDLRQGKWTKLVSYDTQRKLIACNVQTNLPPYTTCKCRIRSSSDKNSWSAWTSYVSLNEDVSIDLFGKYFQVEITLTSGKTTYSSEVFSVTLTTIKPTDSYLYFKEQETSGDQISQIMFSSIDDVSLGNVESDEIDIIFGIIQSTDADFSLSSKLHRDKVSVVDRRGMESTATEDGYFYYVEGGAWATDSSSSVAVYDSNGDLVDGSEYYVVPSVGLLVFYECQKTSFSGSYKDFKINLLYGNNYRIGMNIKSFSNISSICLHDVSWMYYIQGDSVVRRPALPFVGSQIIDDSHFGKLSTENHPSGLGLSTTVIYQHIERDQNGFNGILYTTTGQIINIQTDINGGDILRYYQQNAFLDGFNITQPRDYSYTTVYEKDLSSIVPSTRLVLSTLDSSLGNIGIHYMLGVKDVSLKFGETVGVILGESSYAGISDYGTIKGVPTWLKQSNLLFDKNDKTYGEIDTEFVFIKSTGTMGSVEPSMKFCGKTAKRLVLITPTTISSAGIFSFSLLAVDDNGHIDRQYVGDISLSFDPLSFGKLNSETVSFEKFDNGVKVLGAFISLSSNGVGYICATMSGSDIIFKSNPILITDTIIKWGDLNVPSIFSDGRQNVDFIADYARKVSNLDFVCITDDLSIIAKRTDGNQEWKYIVKQSEDESVRGLYVYSGLRHRSSLLYGERCLIFDDFDRTPDSLLTDPDEFLENPIQQIDKLIEELENYSYISMPIRTPYKYVSVGDSVDSVFSNRGFDFECYKNILTSIPDSEDFVNSKESLVEIYSDHGFCESMSSDYVSNSDNFTSKSKQQYIEHALFLGKKFGFTASGGYASRPGYYTGENSPKRGAKNPQVLTEDGNIISTRGVTAVIANDSSRGSITSALRARKCYATTGARIYLSVIGVSGASSGIMGETIGILDKNANNRPLDTITLNIDVIADKSTVRSVYIYRLVVDETLPELIKVYDGFGLQRVTIAFDDSGEENSASNIVIYDGVGKEICYYVKVEQENGHYAWSSPLWFDFGRIAGIRSEGTSGDKSIREISFSSSTSKYLIGSISSLSNQSVPLSQFNVDNQFPGSQKSLIIGESASTTNYTTRRTYPGGDEETSLIIGDKVPGVYGMRILANGTTKTNVVYGTNYLKFIYNESDFTLFSLNNTDGYNDFSVYSLKYVKDWGMYGDLGSSGWLYVERDKLFGYMWQYSNLNSHIGDGYTFDRVNENTDKILRSSGTNIPIVRDPYMFYDGNGLYGVLYSAYINATYPEDTLANSSKKKLDGYTPGSVPTNVGDMGRIESFAGLLDTDPWTSDYHRISYTNTEGSSEERVFVQTTKITFPNQFAFSSTENANISYSSSPNYISLESEKRVYYLGWFKGKNSKPLLGLFCHRFSALTSSDVLSGETHLCFVFANVGVPDSYAELGRVTSHQSEDFIWPHFKEDQISTYINSEALENWPSGNLYPHPALSLGYNWLSVIMREDGVFYAFFNKNVTRDIEGNVISTGGTGVLYSLDGIDFYEYNSTGSLRIENVKNRSGSNLYYCHPFVYDGKWFMLYRDLSDSYWTQNLLAKVKYSAFNWNIIPDFSPS